MSLARLIDVRTPADPVGVVIVMHGGASRRRRMMVSPAQLSVVRLLNLYLHTPGIIRWLQR